MGIFFLYLFVASATPFFLWIEKRSFAIATLPLLVIMWVMSAYYVAGMLNPLAEILFMILFTVNVVIAHVAAFILYVKPEWWKRVASH